jgi:hypothetical protein
MPTYDPTKKRKSRRSGRDKGCLTYIPAEVLENAGFDPDGPPPFYRTWASRRSKGSIMVQLYVNGDDT